MPRESKLKTPDWILKGGKKPDKKKTEKTFKIKECPKCKSDDVGVVLSGSDSEEGGGREWECHKCKWAGANIIEKELTEDEFMEYLDKKGEILPNEDELKKDFKKTIESADSEDIGDEK